MAQLSVARDHSPTITGTPTASIAAIDAAVSHAFTSNAFFEPTRSVSIWGGLGRNRLAHVYINKYVCMCLWAYELIFYREDPKLDKCEYQWPN